MKPLPIKQHAADQLTTSVYASRSEMGAAAAADISAFIKEKLAKQERVRMIFAAAPSQNEVLACLAADSSIPWQRVEAFHMDEYIGLPQAAPQRFGQFLQQRLFALVPFYAVHYIQSEQESETACASYAELLQRAPIDLVCLGIGENGHLAFNDPPVADFADPAAVKSVELDEACRQQQVNDGCFASLAEVPTHAITLTIPTLLSAERLFCIVPGASKAEAIRRTLLDDISTACPSTILRKQKHCTLYLDQASYGELL